METLTWCHNGTVIHAGSNRSPAVNCRPLSLSLCDTQLNHEADLTSFDFLTTLGRKMSVWELSSLPGMDDLKETVQWKWKMFSFSQPVDTNFQWKPVSSTELITIVINWHFFFSQFWLCYKVIIARYKLISDFFLQNGEFVSILVKLLDTNLRK